DDCRAYVLSHVLNPAFKMNYATARWKPTIQNTVRRWLKAELLKYRASAAATVDSTAHPTPVSATLSAWEALTGLPQLPPSEQSLDEEISAYLTTSTSTPDVNILDFWSRHRDQFPTFYKMAMDYLPIQASAVPSERVFSSSKETDTKRRNRLSPALMEALQLLKYLLKKERLDFLQDLRDDVIQDDEEGQALDDDVLALLV
ncbi:hATC-domain-containing protein, partial [Calocera cornea HHB12733]